LDNSPSINDKLIIELDSFNSLLLNKSFNPTAIHRMSIIDYDQFSIEQLEQLTKELPAQINRRKRAEKKEVKKKLEQLAQQSGFSLQELFSAAEKEAKPKAPPKYFNPTNGDQTWSGKGRKPAWFVEALASGRTESDLLI